MAPNSAFDRLRARWRSQAAAWLIPFGLTNRLKMAARDFVQRSVPGAARALRVKPALVLFTAGLWCLSMPGTADTKTGQLESPPPEPGSIQWEIDHNLAKQRQENYRKRVPIPGTLEENVPRSPTAILINGPRIEPVPTTVSTNAAGNVLQAFFFFAAFVLTGILVARRYGHPWLAGINQRFNSWGLDPGAALELSARIRSEEEAFGEFLRVFRVGPSKSPGTGLPEAAAPIEVFCTQAKERLATLRKLLQDVGRESGDPARKKRLMDLYFEVGALKDESRFPEVLPVWQMAFALEGFLKQLAEKIGNVTPSTLRTVAGGLDLLDDLCVPGLQSGLLTERPPRFLVVDDDVISCQALSLSLKKVFDQPDVAGDGETALTHASRQAYDAIFLDVQMPGMDGFELCSKIRNAGPNRATPVVFVTIQSDFDARCKSTLSGGNDLMGKPFLTFEVTVKALTLVLQGRLRAGAQQPIPQPEQNPALAVSATTVTIGPVRIAGLGLPPQPPPEMLLSETDEMAHAFLVRASKHLGPLWELCQTILQVPDPESRQALLADCFLRINSLVPRQGPEVMHPAYHTCVALEGLLRKMLQSTEYATPSALATMASAVDLLNDLCVPGLKADLAIDPPIHMLVVDDDLVARRALVGALQTSFKKPESAENGEAALALAMEKTFDVIFLDVVMPGMDGFEVCSRIRATAPNRATPVVFVTGRSDFSARAQMSRNGGDDLMEKPFLTSEITVKALTFALRGRLQQLKPRPSDELAVAGERLEG